MKKITLFCIFCFLSQYAFPQVVNPLADLPSDTIYVIDSVDYLPDSLELYEEQRAADFKEANEDFKESEVMKMLESLGSIPYFGEDYLHLDANEYLWL